MRAAETPTHYLVGTSRGRLSQMERDFLTKPWARCVTQCRSSWLSRTANFTSWRAAVPVAIKEQAMRRRRLKKMVKRLHELRQQKLTRDQSLIKLGAARKEAGPAVWRIIDMSTPSSHRKRLAFA